jgi:hypothetical protein
VSADARARDHAREVGGGDSAPIAERPSRPPVRGRADSMVDLQVATNPTRIKKMMAPIGSVPNMRAR